MRGKYDVKVVSKRLQFNLCIERNITIIQGNSATGKTQLVDMIMYSRLKDSPYSVECEKSCYAFSLLNFTENIDLAQYHDSILFFDECVDFTKTHEFASIVKKSDCYFVIITRDPIKTLPYSCKAIYKLEKNVLSRSQDITINDMVLIGNFQTKPSLDLRGKIKLILTEDSNAGFEFFKGVANRMGVAAESCQGNAKVSSKIKECSKEFESGIFIIVDGAAIGCYYEEIVNTIKGCKDVVLYLPESFEYLLIHAGYAGDVARNELTHLWDFVDSEKYFSWERYLTNKIITETSGTKLEYSKNKLNKTYLQRDYAESIIGNIPQEAGLRV